MSVFENYAYYYNTFYADKNYKKEAEQVHYLLQKYGNDIRSIIDFGCGTGQHDIELQGLGYRCVGIDMSEIMIKQAKENAELHNMHISFDIADIRDFRSKCTYDAVISLFHVISYQNTNDDIYNAFRSARSVLEKEGIFIFDVWYGPGVLSDKPSLRVKEVENEKNRLVRISRPTLYDKTNIVDVYYEILVIDKEIHTVDTIHEIHSMRYFFTPEISLLLKHTGFDLIGSIDSDTFDETSFGSWKVYYIARAV